MSSSIIYHPLQLQPPAQILSMFSFLRTTWNNRCSNTDAFCFFSLVKTDKLDVTRVLFLRKPESADAVRSLPYVGEDETLS